MLTPGCHSQGVLYIIRCAYVGKANKQTGISLIVIKHWKNILVEQWTENPCVLGSTPRGTTPPFILPGFPVMEFGLFLCLVMNLHLLFHRISLSLYCISLFILHLCYLFSYLFSISLFLFVVHLSFYLFHHSIAVVIPFIA